MPFLTVLPKLQVAAQKKRNKHSWNKVWQLDWMPNCKELIINRDHGFPHGPVVKNLPSNARDMGSVSSRGTKISHCCCSVKFNSLRPHGLQHARLPSSSPSPRACSNSRPLSHWWHPTISSSVVPFPSCPQSFPVSGSFLMRQLFTSSGQSIGASASALVLTMSVQGWSPLGLTGWISLQSKGPSRVFSNTTVQKHQFFGTQLSLWSNSHIHTWLLETPQLWLMTFAGKVMSLLLHMLSRFVIAFLPRSKWVKVAQSCPTFCNPMDYIVHGILQARILEWVTFPFSRGSSQPRDRTQVSCTAGGFFTSRPFPSKEQVSFHFMAAVTIRSDFGAQENKVCHCFRCFPIYLPWTDGTGCHDLLFLNVEF